MRNEDIPTTHLDAIRRAKTGRVTAVHHISLGWMSPKAYYALQKAHEAEGALLKAVEGGYRVSAALYSVVGHLTLPVLGIEVPIPIGPALATAAAVELALAIETKNTTEALHAGYKLFGPFGALVQLYESVHGALDTAGAIAKAIADAAAAAAAATEKAKRESQFGGPTPPLQPPPGIQL